MCLFSETPKRRVVRPICVLYDPYPAPYPAGVTNFSWLVPLEASEMRRVLDDIRVRCIIVAAHNRKQTSNRHFT